jgi:hypothetical protein
MFQSFFEVLDVFPGRGEFLLQFFNFIRIVGLQVASILGVRIEFSGLMLQMRKTKLTIFHTSGELGYDEGWGLNEGGADETAESESEPMFNSFLMICSSRLL